MKKSVKNFNFSFIILIFILIFIGMAIAAADDNVALYEPKEDKIDKKQFVENVKAAQNKRIILDSISNDDIAKIREKGCFVKQRLKQSTSFECPENVALELSNIPNIRESRTFHILDSISTPQINADDVWAEGITGNNVNVVILDTGVDSSHPELADSYLGGYDFVENDNNPQDGNGHGTHVAGIITANGIYTIDNKKATGVSPNAGFYMLKVCDAGGSCFEDDMEAAMEYAVNNLDAKIMSISIGGGNWGSHCDFDPLAKKVNWVVDNGISVAIASGNDGSGVSFPACASKAIAVGAVDSNNIVQSWSNFGTALDIVAPGVNILSTYICLPGRDCSLNWYAYLSGTSMATPHVSGVIALLLDENFNLTDLEVKNALYSTASNASGCYTCTFFFNGRCYGQQLTACTSEKQGAGVVDAYAAYLSVKQQAQDSDGDGIIDSLDNCINTFNPTQEDTDNDGIGDACDSCTDVDQDSYCLEVNDCNDNNANINPGQADSVCNGIDNDCDTLIDEGYNITPTNCGIGACSSNGQLTCVNGNEVNSCTPGIPAANDATCNNIDDDCDSLIDENYVTTPTACGIGQCSSNGQIECQAGSEVNTCAPGTPTAEICDGLDNDCDSNIDENLIAPLCNNQNGVCSGSTKTCGGFAGWLACDSTNFGPDYEAAESSCSDFLDNDCDTFTDLDDSDCLNCVDSDNDGFFAISAECPIGNDCNDNSNAVYPGASDSICNGVDNDCDNLIDEDYIITQTNCGIGTCSSNGQLTCVNGNELDSCTPGIPAANDASCNNIDEDCDGLTDEDYIPTPTACGIGQCSSNGQIECQAGSEVNTCAPGAPTAEICDGLDNDCDSSVDEGNVCVSVQCWEGDNAYLRRSTSDFRKFCKCAEGVYSYQTYSVSSGRKKAYRYLDTGDNENWDTASINNLYPASQVRCADGNWYSTSQDYFR